MIIANNYNFDFFFLWLMVINPPMSMTHIFLIWTFSLSSSFEVLSSSHK
jgi:hypothetical protein